MRFEKNEVILTVDEFRQLINENNFLREENLKMHTTFDFIKEHLSRLITKR